MKKILVLLVVLMGFAGTAFAQFNQTVMPQGQLQYQQSAPAPQYNQQMPANNLDNWYKYNHPTHLEQQQKIQQQWRNSTAPGVTGVGIEPPPGIMK